MSSGVQPVAASSLDPATLARIRALVHGRAGIVIREGRAGMVRARLSRRLAATGFTDVAAYLDHVEGPTSGGEMTRLISAMTTNVTQFFREGYHFDALASDLVAGWRHRGGLRSIWSAGCASGQEPYSIGITLLENGIGGDRVRILATDIDRAVLARAAAGTYDRKEIASVPPDLLGRHFRSADGGWQVSRDLRELVTFRALNLIGTWPIENRFDAIFCRNVAIYFDAPTQERLWRRLVAALRPGGRLFVGHSERLTEKVLGPDVTYLGRTMYAMSVRAEEQAGSCR